MSGFLGNDIMNLLSGFWHQADTISIAIVMLQCILFICGFFIFFYKIIKLSSYSRAEPMVISGFWGAHNLTAAIDFLVTTKGAKWHNQLVHRAVSAASWKKNQENKGIHSMLPLSDWLSKQLRSGLSEAKDALVFLISWLRIFVILLVFLGFFGSIWAIAHELSLPEETALPLAARLGFSLVPLLISLVASIWLWVFYHILCSRYRRVVSKLKNFMIDVYDFLLAELSDAPLS